MKLKIWYSFGFGSAMFGSYSIIIDENGNIFEYLLGNGVVLMQLESTIDLISSTIVTINNI